MRQPICLNTTDCSGDELVCYHRDPFMHVPGCIGGNSDSSRTDYCVREIDLNPNAKELEFVANPGKGLEQCQGDCDEDSDW